jgi:hypothetical protein
MANGSVLASRALSRALDASSLSIALKRHRIVLTK